MGRLGFSFQLQLTFSEPVNHHSFQLRCLPMSDARQELITSEFHVLPACDVMMMGDFYGLKQSGTVLLPHAGFSVQAEGVVDVRMNIREPAGEEWQLGPYRRFTSLTTPGPVLCSMAAALPEYDPASAIMALLQDHFTYLPGSTHVSTTA